MTFWIEVFKTVCGASFLTLILMTITGQIYWSSLPVMILVSAIMQLVLDRFHS